MKGTAGLFIAIYIVLFTTCSSVGGAGGKLASSDGTEISALGAIGGLEAASGSMSAGNGGSNIRLAVLAPEIQGNVPGHLPIYIQGMLNNNFNKYSAVKLVDRQNLDKILAEQAIALSGSYSDSDFVKIGDLTNSQYFLFGTIQKLTGDSYSLQLSITDLNTGERLATFMKDGVLSQIEGRGTLINEATADLFSQLKIQLTETGTKTLLAGNASTAIAEAGVARGITAQAAGSEVQALFNFAQAATFDPSQMEALARLNTLTTAISGGTISQKILNDIQARNQWFDVFKETTQFFNEHPPFEIIFDPSLIQIGETDYKRQIANLGMRIVLAPSEAGFGALNALLEGLEQTGKRTVWGAAGWPLSSITPKTPGTVVFDGKRSFSYKVDVRLLNEDNKVLGNSSLTLSAEIPGFSAGDTVVFAPERVEKTMDFKNVKAEDLTPTLTIVIAAVNGVSSGELNASGYMRIAAGELEEKKSSFINKDGFTSVIFGPDGKTIIADYGKDIRSWDLTTGRELWAASGHTGGVNSLVYGGPYSFYRMFISKAYKDNNIKAWDTANGKELWTYSLPDGIGDSVSIAINPFSTQFAVGYSSITSSWVSGTFTMNHQLNLKILQMQPRREIRTFSWDQVYNSDVVNSLAFSPDAKQIAAGSGNEIKIWDAETGKEIKTIRTGYRDAKYAFMTDANSIVFSSDGKKIAAGLYNGDVHVWDLADNRPYPEMTFKGSNKEENEVVDIDISPDGKQVASCGWENNIKLWDVGTGKLIRTFNGHNDVVRSVSFRHDGRYIISCSDDGSIKLWNVATGKVVRTWGVQSVRGVWK